MIKQTTEAQLNDKIAAWKHRLTDLSRRNRLLYFKSSNTSTLEIAYPYASELFDQLVIREKTLLLPATKEDAVNLSTTKNQKPGIVFENGEYAARIIRRLYSTYRSAQEEHGVHVLFLALGMLDWQESETADVEIDKSPLVLVPVTLARKSVLDPFTLSLADDEIQVNQPLRVKLLRDFGLDLPQLPEDDDDPDLVKTYLADVQKVIAARPTWSVGEQAVVGIFKPLQQILINDLDKNRARMINNPVIMRLVSHSTPINAGLGEPLEASKLDESVPLEKTFQVLDADSSQQEVIEAAKSGFSFIVQGPPGTGKSQTITNIIAEFIAARKKVLFVSEKMAALEVVYKRLRDTDLDRYCLVLHSQKTNRKQIVEALGDSLNATQGSRSHTEAGSIIEDRLRDLTEERQKLNAYVHALHDVPTSFKLGKSAYSVYAELLPLSGSTHVLFPLTQAEILSITPQLLYSRVEKLKTLRDFVDFNANFQTNVWHGVQRTTLSITQRREIESALKRLQDIESFFKALSQLAEIYGCISPKSISEAHILIDLATNFKPAVMQLPLDDLIADHMQRKTFFQRFDRQYRERLKALRSTQISPVDGIALVELLRTARSLHIMNDPAPVIDSDQLTRQIEQLQQGIADVDQAIQTLGALYDSNNDLRPPALRVIKVSAVQDIVVWAQNQSEQIDDLRLWINWKRTRQETDEMGLKSFIEQAMKDLLPVIDWPDAYRLGFYEQYLDLLTQHHPVLEKF